MPDTSSTFMPTHGAAPWTSEGLNVARLSEQARLIKLQLPEAAPQNAVVVERFIATEGINELFAFTIDTLATSSEFDPFALIGEELSLRLLLANGSFRTWHGYLTAVDALGGDGGLARYRLHLQPWLAALGLRRDSFVYAAKSVQDIVSEVFADHTTASFTFEVTQELPVRPTCVQYRESDLAFVMRLLTEEGLSFRFEHEQTKDGESGGASSNNSNNTTPSHHRLVIFDREARSPDCALSEIRFHRVDATEQQDAITAWSSKRQLVSNAVTLNAWDASVLQAPTGSTQSALAMGDVPVLEHYDGAGSQRYANNAAAARRAENQLVAFESRIKRYNAGGSVRQLGAGERFTLTQHDRYEGQKFVTLRVRHEAANNLGAQAAQVLEAGELEKGSYRNSFEAQPAEAQIAPIWRPKPTAPEAMVALVVGADDDEVPTAVHTQRDHRVQVRFHWQSQRATTQQGSSQSGQGSLVTAGRHASNRQSVWLRVAAPVAGPNWGAHHLPRVGSEVLVSFIEGDIDRPVVSQQLYNGQDLPPWSAGTDSSANHAGVLSGWHSRALDGSGYNQWIADDAPGQVRTRLASSHATSQLNLGHLNAQAPGESNRGAWRGSGAELRSDAWVVTRAGEGLLISTLAQERAAGSVQDTASVRGQLAGALREAQNLSDAAGGAKALALNATALLQPLIDDIDPQKNGHYPGSVNGQDTKEPKGGEGADSRQGQDPVPAFARPLMVLDANMSLNMATPASATVYAGEAIHWTAQEQAHMAAGKTVSFAAGKSVGLYSHEGGIQVIAQEGPVSVQAHTDELEWLAKEGFTVTSSNDEIHVLAKQKITLKGGQTSIELDGMNITLKMPGLLDVKGASKSFVGPKGSPAQLPALPVGDLPLGTVELDHRYHDDEGLAGAKYFLRLPGGGERTGVLDDQGRATISDVPLGGTVSFGPAAGAFARKDKTPTPGHDPDPSEEKLGSVVDKYFKRPAPNEQQGSK
ncbi:type VI secretion system secreted protein VgrG [Variovorax boronicumulans]|uniref:type VI secretion system Vgr family protein n=1 Tax=Variovorax TaxID=34072 RepID=UPI0027899776|nr:MULTISPECIES: type VI secretion system Vgr family protein [Variovorax]MDQ0037109.1 type VI secretion system secreted protein VgrG [Variovorax boronicumulans]MDQ0611036.1 type VI secretion system secreted protein VgrG [Variovorax sp. W1I1]